MNREPPLRVLQLIGDLAIGGAQRVVCTLATELGSVGCEPIVCTWRAGGPLAAVLRSAGTTLEMPARERRGWRRLTVVHALRAVVGRHQPHVIHAHLSDAAVWGVLLQRVTGLPCIVTHHSNDLIDAIGDGRRMYAAARRRLAAVTVRRAAMNIAVSSSVAAVLVQAARVPPERVTVIENGVALPEGDGDARARRLERAATGYPHGPVILSVGRLALSKRQDLLVSAMPRLLSGFPSARLVLLGSGPDAARLQALAAALRIADRVEFPGADLNVARWTKAADLMISASQVEGLSLGVLEAMASGLPIVASDVAGHRELVRDRHTGRLCALDDAGAVADEIIGALEGWRETHERAERARESIRAGYGAHAMAQQHVDLYRRVLRDDPAMRLNTAPPSSRTPKGIP